MSESKEELWLLRHKGSRQFYWFVENYCSGLTIGQALDLLEPYRSWLISMGQYFGENYDEFPELAPEDYKAQRRWTEANRLNEEQRSLGAAPPQPDFNEHSTGTMPPGDSRVTTAGSGQTSLADNSRSM